jgi:hypothetical protein
LGFASFVGVKFSGYVLAGMALKKLQPTITAGVAKIAATRTSMGILLGPPMALLGGFVIGLFIPDSHSGSSVFASSALLLPMRVLIWGLVIFLFTKQSGIPSSKLWTYALAGAVWSCLLDWPGLKLAMIAPGPIPIC